MNGCLCPLHPLNFSAVRAYFALIRHISYQNTDLDPTKLTKARQFSRSSAPQKKADNSLWTETPAERQQRLADEVSGKKRRAVNAEPVEEAMDGKKKRKMDQEIRRGVDEYTVGSFPPPKIR
jgi:hypothetical protein